MEFKKIIYEKKDGVATITKTNPPRNGMSREVLVEMKAALEDARNDDDIRFIVITAAGDGFHSGAQVLGQVRDEVKDVTPWQLREIVQMGHELYRMIQNLEKLVIGVAKGGAGGGGMENLHACDFVIAAETATFSQAEATGGLIAGWGGTQRLPRIVGWRKAKEMLLTGEVLTGKEAEQFGLITKAVPAERLDEEVQALVEKLKRGMPEAQALTKLAMNKVWEAGLTEGLEYEVEAETITFSCENRLEASKAREEGRAPVYKQKRITSGPAWR